MRLMKLKRLLGGLHLSEKARKRILGISSGLLAVLLIFYCFYHFTETSAGDLQTMLVTEDRIETTAVGEAVLFRKETAIPAEGTGLVVPLVAPGVHVAKDTPIATLYAGGMGMRNTYRLLTDYIDVLQSAKDEGDILADLGSLQKELYALSLSLSSALEDGDAGASYALREELRILHSRIEALKQETASLDELLSVLIAERDRLLIEAGEPVETVCASGSGYYYPYADDNYELCTPSVLESLSGDGLQQLRETLRKGSDAAAGAGTFVSDPEWYLAVPTELSAEEISALRVGGSYPVIFPENGDVRIPMKLERTVEGTGENPSFLVFSTLRMPDGFSFDRLQTVHVVTGEMGGFSVPRSALQKLDGYTGVYILEGNMMYFRRVEVLHDLGARYLVKTTDPTPDSEYTKNTYRYIALYDLMILSGTDLFHGRVLS